MKTYLVLTLILFSFNVKGQFCKRDFLEKQCHYPIENKEEIFKKVDTFLYLMSEKDTTYKKWIDREDIISWETPFDEIQSYLKYPKFNVVSIVGIMDFSENEYLIKLLINHKPDSVTTSLIGVYNIVVKYDSITKLYRFKDYRSYYIKNNLDTLKQGTITYYAKNTTKLNKLNCSEFDKFNVQIARDFKVKPKNVAYISLKNSIELLNFFGWDIVYNMFYAPTGGFARFGGKGTKFENLVICGNNSERYDHELIHLYYPELLDTDTTNSTLIIEEGLPTFFGGSSGKRYVELKKTLSEYLDKTDSVKIQHHFLDRSKNIQIDKHTNYIYSMGAFITELFYNKDGFKGLRELANYNNDNFIKNVSTYFNIREDELDVFLRKQLKSSIRPSK